MASSTSISLTWESPFTLDISGVDPDITYCVDVINFTSSFTLHLQCDITITEFSYPIPQDALCHSFILTVSPINVVGRGISSSVSYIGTEAGTLSNCSGPPPHTHTHTHSTASINRLHSGLEDREA